MIEAVGLTKRYGEKLAVNDLSFAVKPGQVTGFLGPNGAGKSTTMRMILGLDAPTSGSVTVGGRPFRSVAHPLREVGALLDAKAVHGGRSAYNHLLCLAQTNNLPTRRVEEVLDLVGLRAVAKKHSKGFSLGMGQRLGIAAALLGDPRVLMFDEPVNGLDPEGILWIRNLMKALAAEGRTVFVSSHLMSEMALTADHLVVIGLGKILADEPMAQFIAKNSVSFVRVRSPQMTDLASRLALRGWRVDPQPDSSVHVYDAQPQQIGDVAGAEGLWLHELTLVQSSLEEAFMRLTANAVEYHAGGPGAGRGALDGAGERPARDAAPRWGTPDAAVRKPARRGSRTPGREPVPPDAQSTAPDPLLDPVPDPAQNPLPGLAQNPAQKPAHNPVPDPTQNPLPGLAQNPTQNPLPGLAQNPAHNPVPDPAQDPLPDPDRSPAHTQERGQ